MHTTTHLAAAVMRDRVASARVAHAALSERIIDRVHRYFRKMVWDPDAAEGRAALPRRRPPCPPWT